MKKLIAIALAVLLTACAPCAPVKHNRVNNRMQDGLKLQPSTAEHCEICGITHVIENNSYEYYEYFIYSEKLGLIICIGSDMKAGEYNIGDIIAYNHSMKTWEKVGY